MKKFKILIEAKTINIKDLNQVPLKSTDTVRVYHGTDDTDSVFIAVTHGMTGDKFASRRYSYESNNNPKGLFVTIDFNTAKEFGSIILEFHARVIDLEPPVWPGDGYTVQGQYSQNFRSSEDRISKQNMLRGIYAKSEDEYISGSDDPYLAYMLFRGPEYQALYKGNLDSNSIRAIWVSKNPQRTKSDYERMSLRDFVSKVKGDGVNVRYGKLRADVSNKQRDDKINDAKIKLFKPRERANLSDFLKRVSIKFRMTEDNVMGIIKRAIKNDRIDDFRNHFWGDEQWNEFIFDVRRKIP
jgi:uncharacterized protein (DUF2267 family)